MKMDSILKTFLNPFQKGLKCNNHQKKLFYFYRISYYFAQIVQTIWSGQLRAFKIQVNIFIYFCLLFNFFLRILHILYMKIMSILEGMDLKTLMYKIEELKIFKNSFLGIVQISTELLSR